jgi:hypothetical protein
MWNPFKGKPEIAKGPPDGGSARAYVRTNAQGERETFVIGEKYPMRGHSREKVLHGKLSTLKDLIKTGMKLIYESEADMVPQEELKLPIRAMAETFDLIIEAEEYEDMKQRWRMAKKVFCHFAEEDDAYCYRYQWFAEKLAKRIKEIKLSKADKYYFYSRKDFKWNL